MRTKYIDSNTRVNLDESRSVWSNGRGADARVELWADKGNVHVWAETNGDPVYGEAELRACLAEQGMDAAVIERVIVGDLAGL